MSSEGRDQKEMERDGKREGRKRKGRHDAKQAGQHALGQYVTGKSGRESQLTDESESRQMKAKPFWATSAVSVIKQID